MKTYSFNSSDPLVDSNLLQTNRSSGHKTLCLAKLIYKSLTIFISLSVWTPRSEDWPKWTEVCSIRTFGSLISRLMKTNQKTSLELLTCKLIWHFPWSKSRVDLDLPQLSEPKVGQMKNWQTLTRTSVRTITVDHLT